ncbi:hypothetical protein MKW98_022249 [Papaver atlanticum]|uniref:Uncharacterized protein n=1 Tax=Papaver atlanticum TaxID=357466 RepID=A0AAD4T3F9_9MAGN|nr:hypothetical protein MKW98_022249 [Papaver atlanticum]
MASSCIKMACPSTMLTKASSIFPISSSVLPMRDDGHKAHKLTVSRGHVVACSATQESSTSATVTSETKESPKAVEKEAPPVKPKAPAKAPPKPLPELMEQDVIPSLKVIFEAQADILDVEIFFSENKLEGSFVKNDTPYSFWAFFPDGVLTGPKGFSLTSYGNEVSTIEPFLIDEKKVTAKHVVFWVEKRLAAQGILPVWKNDQ